MRLHRCAIGLLLSVMCLGELPSAQTRFEGAISTKTGSHFIGLQFDVSPNDHVRLEMLTTDSSRSFTLLDSTFRASTTVLLAVHPESGNMPDRHDNRLVISYPKVKTGEYLIRYIRNGTVSVQKILLMK